MVGPDPALQWHRLDPPPWFQGRSTQLSFVIANSAYPVVDLPVEQRHWRCPSKIVTIREEYLPVVRDLVRAHLFLFNLTNDDHGLVLGYDSSFDFNNQIVVWSQSVSLFVNLGNK